MDFFQLKLSLGWSNLNQANPPYSLLLRHALCVAVLLLFAPFIGPGNTRAPHVVVAAAAVNDLAATGRPLVVQCQVVEYGPLWSPLGEAVSNTSEHSSGHLFSRCVTRLHLPSSIYISLSKVCCVFSFLQFSMSPPASPASSSDLPTIVSDHASRHLVISCKLCQFAC